MLRKQLSDDIRFVWAEDPAFDHSNEKVWAEAWAKYDRTGDYEALPVKEDKSPTVFVCRPLSVPAYRALMRRKTETDKILFAIRASLKQLENFKDDAGKDLRINSSHIEDQGDFELLDEEVLGWFFNGSLLGQLGGFIMKFSQLDPTRGQG